MDTTLLEENISRSVTNRTLMWKRTGALFAESPATAEEAIVKAGLDWDVELRKLGYKTADGKSFKVVPGGFAVVRTDTETPLGTVRSRYTPFSNRHAFDFADNLVDGAGAAFESAWEMNGGKTVGLTMRLPNHVTVGGEDVFDQYLILKTSHDGSTAIQVGITNVRMACLNQFNVTLRNAKRKWSVVHSPNAGTRLQQAREALELAFVYNQEFEAELEKLLTTTVSEDRAKYQMDNILKANRVGDRSRDQITTAIMLDWMNSPTIQDDQRNTAYGLLNAATEYFDHLRDYRTAESAIKVTTEGLGARFNQALMDQLVAA